jgi:hypothetical protein
MAGVAGYSAHMTAAVKGLSLLLISTGAPAFGLLLVILIPLKICQIVLSTMGPLFLCERSTNGKASRRSGPDFPHVGTMTLNLEYHSGFLLFVCQP